MPHCVSEDYSVYPLHDQIVCTDKSANTQRADAVCCSVLQCVTVCCSVLQCVAVCCSVLQCVAVWFTPCRACHPVVTLVVGGFVIIFSVSSTRTNPLHSQNPEWTARCCSVLQYVAVCSGVLQFIAVCSIVLQCVAACCSMSQSLALTNPRAQRAVAVRRFALQCIAVCCWVLQYVQVCCSPLHRQILQHTGVHFRALQCVRTCVCRMHTRTRRLHYQRFPRTARLVHQSVQISKCTYPFTREIRLQIFGSRDLNESSVNPKSTSNQSSKLCTVLQYPSKNKNWISRSTSFPDRSFEWRGLRLHTWKLVWKFGDSRENVLDMYVHSCENVSKFLAFVINWSPTSFVCGVYQKRPIFYQKRPMIYHMKPMLFLSKKTHTLPKETYIISKEIHILSKETYSLSKEDLWSITRTLCDFHLKKHILYPTRSISHQKRPEFNQKRPRIFQTRSVLSLSKETYSLPKETCIASKEISIQSKWTYNLSNTPRNNSNQRDLHPTKRDH